MNASSPLYFFYMQMLNHPQHVVIPYHRYQIYKLFEKENYFLKRLSYFTVQSVLPIWIDHAQKDRSLESLISAQLILQEAKKVIFNNGSEEKAKMLAVSAWEDFEELVLHKNIHPQALLSFMAAITMLFEATGEIPFEGFTLTEQTTDNDIDPWSSDATKYAYLTYSTEDNNQVNPEKCLNFFGWWFSNAIPLAQKR